MVLIGFGNGRFRKHLVHKGTEPCDTKDENPNFVIKFNLITVKGL